MVCIGLGMMVRAVLFLLGIGRMEKVFRTFYDCDSLFCIILHIDIYFSSLYLSLWASLGAVNCTISLLLPNVLICHYMACVGTCQTKN